MITNDTQETILDIASDVRALAEELEKLTEVEEGQLENEVHKLRRGSLLSISDDLAAFERELVRAAFQRVPTRVRRPSAG